MPELTEKRRNITIKWNGWKWDLYFEKLLTIILVKHREMKLSKLIELFDMVEFMEFYTLFSILKSFSPEEKSVEPLRSNHRLNVQDKKKKNGINHIHKWIEKVQFIESTILYQFDKLTIHQSKAKYNFHFTNLMNRVKK